MAPAIVARVFCPMPLFNFSRVLESGADAEVELEDVMLAPRRGAEHLVGIQQPAIDDPIVLRRGVERGAGIFG